MDRPQMQPASQYPVPEQDLRWSVWQWHEKRIKPNLPLIPPDSPEAEYLSLHIHHIFRICHKHIDLWTQVHSIAPPEY